MHEVQTADPKLVSLELIRQLRFRPRRVPEYTYGNYPILLLPT